MHYVRLTRPHPCNRTGPVTFCFREGGPGGGIRKAGPVSPTTVGHLNEKRLDAGAGGGMQACRHADVQACRHADMQARRDAETQACRCRAGGGAGGL